MKIHIRTFKDLFETTKNPHLCFVAKCFYFLHVCCWRFIALFLNNALELLWATNASDSNRSWYMIDLLELSRNVCTEYPILQTIESPRYYKTCGIIFSLFTNTVTAKHMFTTEKARKSRLGWEATGESFVGLTQVLAGRWNKHITRKVVRECACYTGQQAIINDIPSRTLRIRWNKISQGTGSEWWLCMHNETGDTFSHAR